MPGKTISQAEILNVSPKGLWMNVLGQEYFLPYDQHPWFKEATVKELYHFEFLNKSLLHWPDLDVDLALDSLQHPEKYPLMSHKLRKASQRKAA